MSWPASWLVDRVVSAKELGAAGHHRIPSGRIVDSGLLRVRVGACANEIALADESGDIGGWAAVAFDEGSIWLRIQSDYSTGLDKSV